MRRSEVQHTTWVFANQRQILCTDCHVILIEPHAILSARMSSRQNFTGNATNSSQSADNSPDIQTLNPGIGLRLYGACSLYSVLLAPLKQTLIGTNRTASFFQASERTGVMQTSLVLDDDIHEDSLHVGNTKSQQYHHIPIAASALLLSILNLLVPLKPIPRIFATAALLVSLLAFGLASRGRPSSTALALLSITATLVAYSTHFVRTPVSVTSKRIPSIFEMPNHEDSVPLSSAVHSAHPVDALNAVERSQAAHPHAGDDETEFLENALDETRSLPLPPGTNGTYIVNTHTGESCSRACLRYAYVCAPKDFASVNLCPVLTVRLGCDSCKVVPGSHHLAAALPSAQGDGNGKQCLSLEGVDVEAAQCHVSFPGVQRLCPCVA